MARALRIEYPGAYYHVINRGNASQAVTNRCNKVKELKVADRRIRRDVNRLLNNE